MTPCLDLAGHYAPGTDSPRRYAAFITARLGSLRLPRKALAEVCGKPLLERVIERVRIARRPDVIVLCTTREPDDDALAATAHALDIEVFRGDRDDILVRWLGAADEYEVDFFAACDGDDIFCDPVHVDRLIECYEESAADYITCTGLPFGAAPTGVSREGLRRVCAAKSENVTEGQGRFFQDDRLVRRAEVAAPANVRHDTVRMTIDYPEDLEFAAAVTRRLETPDGPPFTLEAIVALLNREPELVEINRGRQEEYWQRFNERYPPVAYEV